MVPGYSWDPMTQATYLLLDVYHEDIPKILEKMEATLSHGNGQSWLP
jgi:hypothetical protein